MRLNHDVLTRKCQQINQFCFQWLHAWPNNTQPMKTNRLSYSNFIHIKIWREKKNIVIINHFEKKVNQRNCSLVRRPQQAMLQLDVVMSDTRKIGKSWVSWLLEANSRQMYVFCFFVFCSLFPSLSNHFHAAQVESISNVWLKI